MNTKDKQLAEAVLRRLCEGATIGGIRFGPILQMLISHVDPDGVEPIRGQVYLNLAPRWKVYPCRPVRFPNTEDELPEWTNEEEIQAIFDLRERVITNAELAETEPHLILTLDDGRVVFVNGKHDKYECWDMGTAYNEEKWLIVACPGGEVALWTPRNFDFKVDE